MVSVLFFYVFSSREMKKFVTTYFGSRSFAYEPSCCRAMEFTLKYYLKHIYSWNQEHFALKIVIRFWNFEALVGFLSNSGSRGKISWRIIFHFPWIICKLVLKIQKYLDDWVKIDLLSAFYQESNFGNAEDNVQKKSSQTGWVEIDSQ